MRVLVPPRALGVALNRAHALARHNPDIRAVGVGFKHSRKRGGYGRQTQPCIKFIVDRKHGAGIPPFLEVRVGRRCYRVPTDVEELGGLSQHAAGRCSVRDGTSTGGEGLAGFTAETESGKRLLVTAGHVLFDHRPKNPWSPGARAWVGSVEAGPLVAAHTYYASGTPPLLYDIGVVALRRPVDAPPLTPFTSRFVTAAQLAQWFSTPNGAPLCTLSAPGGSLTVHLDSLLRVPLPWSAAAPPYAPLLIVTRSLHARFEPGHSGGALIAQTGECVGLHVLGRTASGQTNLGVAMAVPTIKQQLELRLGERVRLR